MRINNNIQAFNAFRNLSTTQGMLSKNLEKLSSGFRINRAADDAAGLVTSENLRAKIGGLRVASRNAQDGISVVQTAEGALQEVHTILQRMRDLAVQAANTGGNTDEAIEAAQDEVDQLVEELDRLFTATKYGDKTLFDATTAQTFTFQIGADATDTVALTVGTANVGSTSLEVNAISLGSATGASAAITSIDLAIDQISTLRGELGAFQNRMESTIRNLGVAVENLTAAESRIRDTDMALETVSFTKNQILQQAGVAMLAQANASQQSVLRLLQ